jgi:hypothetical protein
LDERNRSHGGQTHVKVRLVEDFVSDFVLAEFLDSAEERWLIGHTDNYAGGNIIWIGSGKASRHLESGVVGLDKLLGETDVLTDKDVKVGVRNLVLLHILEPPWLYSTAKSRKTVKRNPIGSYIRGFVKPF